MNPSPARAGAWRSIFDGTTKDGWEMVGPGDLRLEDGALVTHGGMGLLWYSKEQFGDCQLRVVFKLTRPEDNSGIFIRIPAPPADPWFAVHHGYEVQIYNPGGEFHRTGCFYSLTKALQTVEAQASAWNEILITLDGPRTLVEVNGVLVTDHSEGDPSPEKKIWYEPERGPRPRRGFIGLQNHDDNSRVHFREVSVRPLVPRGIVASR